LEKDYEEVGMDSTEAEGEGAEEYWGYVGMMFGICNFVACFYFLSFKY
jgi:hypothetical protein